MEHADYPHHPGTLYDCAACEAACFCEGDFQCVACAIDDVEAEDFPAATYEVDEDGNYYYDYGDPYVGGEWA